MNQIHFIYFIYFDMDIEKKCLVTDHRNSTAQKLLVHIHWVVQLY